MLIMIFNSLIKPKATLTTLPETATLDEALTVLEDTGYRCVPRQLAPHPMLLFLEELLRWPLV